MNVFLIFTDTIHGVFVTAVYKTKESAIQRIELDGYKKMSNGKWFKRKNGHGIIRYIVEEEVKD